jgi:hypothetical protein
LVLLPGIEYDLVLANAPDNVYLASARLDTGNVLERGLMLTQPVAAELEVVVSPSGWPVTGVSEPGANVLLLPEDGRLEKYQTTAANEYGAFSFRGVAPGEYRVIAWLDDPPCEFYDPIRSRACSTLGVPLDSRSVWIDVPISGTSRPTAP